jgi:hypothetical protein
MKNSSEGIILDTDKSEQVILGSDLLSSIGISAEEVHVTPEQITRINELVPGINTENLISLDNFPKSIPAPPERYDKRVLEGSDMDNTFSRHIISYLAKILKEDPQKFEKIKEKFIDTVIVDIGAGSGTNGRRIARRLGAKGYIGVEPFNWKDLFRKNLTEEISGEIPFNLVIEDGLTFLRRLPDDSVSLLSAGIADEIIGNDDYLSELEVEMLRVLKKGGVCMVSNSAVPQGLYTKGHTLIINGGAGTSDSPISFLVK